MKRPNESTVKPQLRVHIVPVGFEVMRAVDPLRVLRADRAILVTRRKDDDASLYLKRIQEILSEIGIPYEVKEREVWNVSAMVKAALEIAHGHMHDSLHYNVSTGAKTASIAGTLASMFAPIQPYYQSVNYQLPTVHLDHDYPCRGDPVLVPTFRAPELGREILHTLMIIAGSPEPLSKKRLIGQLEEAEVIKPNPQAKFRDQAMHGRADSLLDKLEDLDFVEVTGRRREKRISATWKGREAAEMFAPLLHANL